MMSDIKTAVIPAAGMGTRFLPATKAIPKELVPIVDKPAIQYIVEECVRAGIDRVVFVISKGKESIRNYFKNLPALDRLLAKKGRGELVKPLNELTKRIKFSVVYQNQPKGLGHAILQAEKAVRDNPFAVILPDDLIVSVTPAIKQLIEVFEQRKGPVLALERIPQERLSSYGVIGGIRLEERLYKINEVVEKPKRPQDAPSDLTIVGRYILPPEIFRILKKIRPAKDGEIQLTAALAVLMNQRNFYGFEFYGDRYDVGDRAGFIKANVSFAMRDSSLKTVVEHSAGRFV